MQLQPQLLKLESLLNGRLFKIPEYQRAYSWETKQRDDLFNDILRVKSSDEDHFMATIVGLVRGRKKIGADEYLITEIVDGQQRLTTLVILLKSAQEELNKSEKTEGKIYEEISQLLVKQDDFNLLLLQTNHDTSDIFGNYIRDAIVPTAEAVTSADQNLINAINECKSFVTRWKSEGSTLVELVATIRHKLWAIFHSVEDEGLVYRVFEVLNSRGLEVSWIDKLKSQLMGLAFDAGVAAGRDEAIKDLHLIWQDIYRTIGRKSYLSAETIRFAGTFKSATIPSRPLSESASVDRLVEMAGGKVKNIVACANWLRAVVKAEDRLFSSSRQRAVTAILQARLVAISIILRKFPKDDEKRILGRWERVSFRLYGLRRLDARNKVGDYTRLAWSIINEELTPDDILNRLSDIGKTYPIADVIDQFDAANCYEGWTDQLRYLLFRYEEHLCSKRGQKVNESQWNKIWMDEPAKSIEHIKPQSANVSYIHSLGNLMMLPPGVNSSLKDKDQKIKMKIYASSGLLSSEDVSRRIKLKSWDKSAVDKRTKEILKWAKAEWKD